MDELQEILDNPEKRNEIKQAAVFNASYGVYTYKKTGLFQSSGKTRELLISNLLTTIKGILRSR